MAKVATSAIFNFFDTIVNNQIEYCVMCLRTQQERRLVTPDALTMFMKTLTNREQFQCVKVCYICEAKALASMRFISHLQLALNVDQIFTKLKQYPDFKRRLRRDVNLSLTGQAQSRTDDLSKVLEYEQMIAKMRISTEITRTDVLVVYTDSKHNMQDNFEYNVQLNSTGVETVVIDDDIPPDPPLEPYPTHLIVNNNAPPFPIAQINNPQTPGLQTTGILYSIGFNQGLDLNQRIRLNQGIGLSQGGLIVPNVQLHDQKTLLPDSSKKSELMKQTPDKNRVLPMAKKKPLNLRPKHFNVPARPIMVVEPLSGLHVKEMVNSKGWHTFASMQPVVVLNRLPDRSAPKEQKRTTQTIIDDELDRLLLQKSQEMKRVSDKRKSANKRPCKNDTEENVVYNKDANKIDWEDRIPMDVISVVESNNINNFIGSSQVKISDVRSERDVYSDVKETEKAITYIL